MVVSSAWIPPSVKRSTWFLVIAGGNQLNFFLTIKTQLEGMSRQTLTTRALTVVKSGSNKYDAKVEEKTIGPLRPGQVLVRMTAAAFNHRDVRTRILNRQTNYILM